MNALARISLADQSQLALRSLSLSDQLAVYVLDWWLGSSVEPVMIEYSWNEI